MRSLVGLDGGGGVRLALAADYCLRADAQNRLHLRACRTAGLNVVSAGGFACRAYAMEIDAEEVAVVVPARAP